jgi:hypothetical protein
VTEVAINFRSIGEKRERGRGARSGWSRRLLDHTTTEEMLRFKRCFHAATYMWHDGFVNTSVHAPSPPAGSLCVPTVVPIIVMSSSSSSSEVPATIATGDSLARIGVCIWIKRVKQTHGPAVQTMRGCRSWLRKCVVCNGTDARVKLISAAAASSSKQQQQTSSSSSSSSSTLLLLARCRAARVSRWQSRNIFQKYVVVFSFRA